PWLVIAVLCEGLLEDKEDTISVIRIVDQFTVPRPPDWDGKANMHLRLTGLVGFKSGDVKGTRTLRIYGTSPTGKRQKVLEVPVEFLGGNQGVNIKLNITFGFKTEGTHWIDVRVDNWLATRMPLTIVLESMKTSADE